MFLCTGIKVCMFAKCRNIVFVHLCIIEVYISCVVYPFSQGRYPNSFSQSLVREPQQCRYNPSFDSISVDDPCEGHLSREAAAARRNIWCSFLLYYC